MTTSARWTRDDTRVRFAFSVAALPSAEAARWRVEWSQSGRRLDRVSIADQLFEERRLRRRAGDPRLSDDGREVLRRITTGDLADEFGRSLEEISDADPLLTGTDDHD